MTNANPILNPLPPAPSSPSYTTVKLNQQPWNIFISSQLTAPSHQPIQPTFSDSKTSQPLKENMKTLARPCIPLPPLSTQLPMTALSFQLYFNIYPRPQWISTASSIRGKYQRNPTTHTNSESDGEPATQQNYGGFLYTNFRNTGMR